LEETKIKEEQERRKREKLKQDLGVAKVEPKVFSSML
jgi:hypothetical protein